MKYLKGTETRNLFAFEVAIEDLELRAVELISVVLGVGGDGGCVRTERTGGEDTVRFVSSSYPQRQRASLILRESPHLYLTQMASSRECVLFVEKIKRTARMFERGRTKI
jgi:hypothetical protein